MAGGVVVQEVPGLQLWDSPKIDSGDVYPFNSNPALLCSRYEDKRGVLFIEGDGFYGEVEVLLSKTQGGTVEKRVRLDGQKGVTEVRGSADGLYYFKLENRSTGTRYPKLYKWMEEVKY